MADSDQSGAGATQGASGGKNVTTNLELLQQFKIDGVEAMFAVQPLTDCDHLKEVTPVPEDGLNVNDQCVDCDNKGENWVCLICYKVYCSRYVKEHMVEHEKATGHPVVLSYADLSVWCYQCDNYLDNEVKFWVGEFKRGRTSLEDEAKSGRPLDATDEEMSTEAGKAVSPS